MEWDQPNAYKMISGRKEPIPGYSGSWDSHVEWLTMKEVKDLEPPNLPDDEDHLSELKDSMAQNGWKGPPLLLLIFDDGEIRLLQGSHRIAAAREIGLAEIPFIIVRGEDTFDDSPFVTAYKIAMAKDKELADAVSRISDESLI